MDITSGNFEYVLQLTKVLSSESRANRQESDKIESILRRLAKQSGVSYDQLSDGVSQSTQDAYNRMAVPSLADQLIAENYELIYQIELQEYINHKIWALINEIIEHLGSIRGFIIESKLTGTQNVDFYLQDKFDSKLHLLEESSKNLQSAKQLTQEKLSTLYEDLRNIMNEINWEAIPRDSRGYKRISNVLSYLKNSYGVDLLPEAK